MLVYLDFVFWSLLRVWCSSSSISRRTNHRWKERPSKVQVCSIKSFNMKLFKPLYKLFSLYWKLVEKEALDIDKHFNCWKSLIPMWYGGILFFQFMVLCSCLCCSPWCFQFSSTILPVSHSWRFYFFFWNFMSDQSLLLLLMNQRCIMNSKKIRINISIWATAHLPLS